jgi:hypothetical protein
MHAPQLPAPRARISLAKLALFRTPRLFSFFFAHGITIATMILRLTDFLNVMLHH